MKKLIVLLLLVTLGFVSLSAAGKQDAGNEASSGEMRTMVLRFGINNPDGHPLVEASKEFGAILEKKSGGKYKIEYYTNGQLGDKKTHMTALQTGTLDFYMIMGGFLSDYGVKLLNVPMLPYLFDGVDHARAVQAGPIGEKLLSAIQEAGTKLVGIGMYQEASRNFFFTDNPVTAIVDMQGLKIRAQVGSIYEKLLESFGCSVVPVAFSELYSALQTGVVDGAEQPYSGYSAKHFYEVAPYFLLDGHETSPNYVIASELTWSKFPEADKKMIVDSFNESVANFNKMSGQKDLEIIAELKSAGVTFLEPDNLQEWKDAAVPLYPVFAPGYEDLIKEIQNTKY